MGLFNWLFGTTPEKEATSAGSAATNVTPAPAATAAALAALGDAPPPPPRPPSIAVADIGDVAVVTFAKNAFYGSGFPARDELFQLVDEQKRRNLLLDFGNIEHLFSYALGSLITLLRKIQAAHGKLVFWHLNQYSLHILKVTKADQIFVAVNEPDHITAADVIRELFGRPSPPPVFPPEWRTDTVLALARQMYESREFSAMPILADALQDAGCDNDDILSHCRGDWPHIRGCWVVNLVLDRKEPSLSPRT